MHRPLVRGRQKDGAARLERAAELRWGGTHWLEACSGMVGCCIGGPIDGKEMPFGLCDWLDVFVFIGAAPYFAVEIQNYQEAGGKQPGV